jgi:limonene-1,2-epoxide hydrolase
MARMRRIRSEIRTLLASDRLVIVERLDIMRRASGDLLTLPICGVFELDAAGGIIA